MPHDNQELSAEQRFYQWLVMPVMHEVKQLRHDVRIALHDISRKLEHMEKKLMAINDDVDGLVAAVSDIKTVNASVISLLDKIFAMIGAAPNLQAVRDATAALKAEKDSLAAAVVRDTPADGASGEPPVPPV